MKKPKILKNEKERVWNWWILNKNIMKIKLYSIEKILN